jgi:multidrug efflux pump subunit AcrB
MSATPPAPANGERSRFNLSAWALEHQPLIRYLMVVLLAAGVLSFFGLGQDEDPPFTFRTMVIRAYWPGATAQQMAEQVADRIERKLQEVPYADKIRSSCTPMRSTLATCGILSSCWRAQST